MRITTKEQAQKLTVPKLREELGLRGLPQEGLKAALVQRLISDIESNEKTKVGGDAEVEADDDAETEAEDNVEGEVEDDEEVEDDAEAEVEDDAEAGVEDDAETDPQPKPHADPNDEAAVNGETAEADAKETLAAEVETNVVAAEVETDVVAAEVETDVVAAEVETDVVATEVETDVVAAKEEAETEETVKTDSSVASGVEAVGASPKVAASVANTSEVTDSKVELMVGDETKADPADVTPDEMQTETEKPKSPAGAVVAKSPASTGGKQVPSSASARAPAAARRRSAESKASAAAVMSEDKQKGKKKENGDHGGVDDDAASVGGDDEPPTKKAKTSNGSSVAKRTKPPRAPNDPSGREIFIDNLPIEANEASVMKLAEAKGGPVVQMRVMVNRVKKPKGTKLALVRFAVVEDAQRALQAIPKEKMGKPPRKLGARQSSNDNTLFVGNLNKNWTKEVVLRQVQNKLAGVVNVEVTMDALSKNLNRGFGFITFASIEACRTAHAQCHSQRMKILDNYVVVDWADSKGGKEDDERGVYITNLDEHVDDGIFRKHFSKFGVIEKVVFGRAISHANRKDFAIINFATRKAAQRCISEGNSTTFQGRLIEVTMAQAKKKRTYINHDRHVGGGGRRGRGGRGSFGGRGGGRYHDGGMDIGGLVVGDGGFRGGGAAYMAGGVGGSSRGFREPRFGGGPPQQAHFSGGGLGGFHPPAMSQQFSMQQQPQMIQQQLVQPQQQQMQMAQPQQQMQMIQPQQHMQIVQPQQQIQMVQPQQQIQLVQPQQQQPMQVVQPQQQMMGHPQQQQMTPQQQVLSPQRVQSYGPQQVGLQAYVAGGGGDSGGAGGGGGGGGMSSPQRQKYQQPQSWQQPRQF